MNQNIVKLNHTNHSIASDILELSLQSYRIECDLLGLETFPPLNESTNDIEKSEGIFWGLYEENTLVAVLEISTLILERNTNAKNIDRLVVSPEYFRRGFAQALLKFCCSAQGVYSVSTGEENLPAVRLYEKYGFVLQSKRKLSANLTISSFQKVVA